ncbi:DUF6090 family protein [Portibacter lacus]|uniref:Uncharacterized protein n=1 Tax=Portibacter lacus TaxID=1099794 RepID=A0AA37WF27_9BACT|nr:DUF6090 family protein [Portibacter lacus]GLR18222.1 hypothetical protein GCM10007940_28370 [Portibacter lacus]
MIKFFRKIRQKLLSENKFSKYLIYAIGEIILVVSGILIALQINNANENRKLKELEVSTFKEIKANLIKDIEDFETNIRWHGISVQSSQVILDALKNRTSYHDTLSKHLSRIPANPIFMPTTSAYQNLKINGFSLISNDSLRIELQGLYEARYVYTAKITDAGYDYDYEEFGKAYQREMSTYSLIREARPVDYNSLFTNQQFVNLISHKMARDKHQIIPNYKERIEQVKKIIQMIDNELSNQ